MHHTDPHALFLAVGRALDGGAPFVIGRPSGHIPEDAALVLPTSGSTAAPRHVALSAAAVLASGAATADRLGGTGHWVLALPADHVAGVQVLARAHAAQLGITAAEPGAPFTAEAFEALARRSVHGAAGARRYVSLVPTQLHRLFVAADQGQGAGLDALCGFDAVLVGGAALPHALSARARAEGLPLVQTYGMTETCGGCVYDGVPLAGVDVHLTNPTDAGAVIEIAGPVLALGYVGADDNSAFFRDGAGRRRFRTSDLGAWTEAPRRLTVLGRADDLIITGGVNISPAAVEAVVGATPGVGEVCVIGVPDDEWGQAVVAVVTPTGTHRDEQALAADLRRRVADSLGRAAVPRRIVVVPELPHRGPGKIDRRAVIHLVPSPDVRA